MHHCTNRCLLATVLARLYLDAAVGVHFSTKIPLCVLEFRCWKVQFWVVLKDAIRSSFISMHWQMLGSSKNMIIYAWQKLNLATYLLHISVDIFSDPGPAIKVWKKKLTQVILTWESNISLVSIFHCITASLPNRWNPRQPFATRKGLIFFFSCIGFESSGDLQVWRNDPKERILSMHSDK